MAHICVWSLEPYIVGGLVGIAVVEDGRDAKNRNDTTVRLPGFPKLYNRYVHFSTIDTKTASRKNGGGNAHRTLV